MPEISSPGSTVHLPQEGQQLEMVQNDHSWLRTPPGGPQVPDRQASMELDAAAIDLSPAPASLKPPPAVRSFAMDDLEAAETLAGFARQSSPPVIKPTPTTTAFPTYPSSTTQPQPEPLLSLLTSQHPLIGSAISGSLSAYNFGKSYSSQFRYGAEYVERNIASPVASTVGTAGRITGVENGVRRWLSRGRSQQSTGEDSNGGASSNGGTPVAPAGGSAMSPSSSNGSNKRRREDSETEMEQPQAAQRSRAGSEISISQGEYLPAYDSNMSPTYSSRDPYPPLSPQQHSLGNSTWQTRLILSTSGLGIAMSGESRRSLKYCLRWLRWANGRLGRLVFSLQSLLAEYDAAAHRRNGNGASANGQMQQFQPRDQAAITAQLAALRTECEKVLKKAVDVVSNYTGGALPENARALVHRHLTSLPARFAFALRGEQENLGEDEEMANGEHHQMQLEAGSAPASSRANGNGPHTNGGQPNGPQAQVEKSESEIRRDTVRAAKRMVVLAREGLEMMGQVSLVVDSTITSAEEWCNRLGRRIPEDEDAEMASITNGDSEPGQAPPPPPAQEQNAHAYPQLQTQDSEMDRTNGTEMEIEKS